MIKALRVVLGGDKPYQDVQMMMPGEMDTADVDKILGNDKTVVFNTPGIRRSPKWVFTHAQNISLIILDNTVRRSSNAGNGLPFERIVLGNSSYAAGHIVLEEDYESAGIPQELLDSKIFDQPVVFVVQEGLCVTNAATVTSLESAAGAPKAKQGDKPPVTNEPLKQYSPDEIRGPSLEQISRANAQVQARKDQHGGPLRGTSHGGNETFSEVGTDAFGNPVSRDITRPAIQDQGPGREGGPINPPKEFDATKLGDVAGHGKNFGHPEGIRGQSTGSVGSDADRAANVGEFTPTTPKAVAPVTNVEGERHTPHTSAVAAATAASADSAKAEVATKAATEAKAVSAPAMKTDEKVKTVAKPKDNVAQATKDVKSTEATKQADAGIKAPTGSEADKVAQVVPTPIPEPVKVDPAPGQKIVEVKTEDKK